MPRSQATTLSLPPFAGVTRRLILINVAAFFAVAVLEWVSPRVLNTLVSHLILVPAAVLRGEIWQLATYSLVEPSLLGILFGSLTLWFAGSLLEGSFGSQWVLELYAVSAIGGGLLASLLSFTHVFGLRPDLAATGAWAAIFGLLMAIAMRFGDQEFLLWFVLRLKAKYMVAIYLLIAVAVLLKQGNPLGALLQLTGALAGFLYVRFAPRRGLASGFSEWGYSLRNDYIRARRRRAARKFEVYMRKQNREVRFDADGRYIEPDDLPRSNGSPGRGGGKRHDPNDRSRMN